jgi:biotin carboxyl carrier protein
MKMFRVVVNGNEYKVGIEELPEENSAELTQITPITTAIPASPPAQQRETQQILQHPEQPTKDMSNTGENVTAPMPGTIISVAVTAGTVVSKGQILLILEAMKMENEIKAPLDGTIKDIRVGQGTSVNAGDILVVLAS